LKTCVLVSVLPVSSEAKRQIVSFSQPGGTNRDPRCEPINEIRSCRFRVPSFDVEVEGRKNALQGEVMARQHAVFQNRKSIVGAALVGLGLSILLRNVAEAATLVRILQAIEDQAGSLGMLAAASMAVEHFLQGYLFNHAEFLGVLYQVLLSFLGLLLIGVGTIFLHPVFAGGERLKKKNRACRFRCLSFDA
jgi:hypothetical protein